MRVSQLLLLGVLAVAWPAACAAQDYRLSVLYVADADTADASGVLGEATVDSTGKAAVQGPVLQGGAAKPPGQSLAGPIVGGVVAGTVFATMGLLIGNAADPNTGDDISDGVALGFLIGESVGVGIGANAGNHGRGSLAGDLGVAFLGQLAALGLGSVGGGPGYILGIAGQLTLTAMNERSTANKRDARDAAAP